MFGRGKKEAKDSKKDKKGKKKEKKVEIKKAPKMSKDASLYEKFLALKALLEDFQGLRQSWWWAIPVIGLVVWFTFHQEQGKEREAAWARLNDL